MWVYMPGILHVMFHFGCRQGDRACRGSTQDVLEAPPWVSARWPVRAHPVWVRENGPLEPLDTPTHPQPQQDKYIFETCCDLPPCCSKSFRAVPAVVSIDCGPDGMHRKGNDDTCRVGAQSPITAFNVPSVATFVRICSRTVHT